MKFLISLVLLFAFGASAQTKKPTKREQQKITYFSCTVKEGRTDVSVKFAIRNFKPTSRKGQLVTYPGADEEQGMIYVNPVQVKNSYTKMSNLNGQGGDLTIQPSGDIHLFGDGDGYQFTDLVLWYQADDDRDYREGYVRDYGSAYADGEETFKQFIKCEHSETVL